MNIITKDEFLIKKEYYFGLIEEGAIFIYPTDVKYVIGCDARNKNTIKNIRKIKHLKKQPLPIIAPSIEWINENCLTTEEIEDTLEELPGKLTFLLNTNEISELAGNINLEDDSIAVRIPEHWISNFVKEMNFPIVATSANILGNDFMTDIDNLDPDIAGKVDFMIFEGNIKISKPTTYDFRSIDIKDINK